MQHLPETIHLSIHLWNPYTILFLEAYATKTDTPKTDLDPLGDAVDVKCTTPQQGWFKILKLTSFWRCQKGTVLRFWPGPNWLYPSMWHFKIPKNQPQVSLLPTNRLIFRTASWFVVSTSQENTTFGMGIIIALIEYLKLCNCGAYYTWIPIFLGLRLVLFLRYTMGGDLLRTGDLYQQMDKW